MRANTKIVLWLGLLVTCAITTWWLFFNAAYDHQRDRNATVADQARGVRPTLAEPPMPTDQPLEPFTLSVQGELSVSGHPVLASPQVSGAQRETVAVKSPMTRKPSGEGVQLAASIMENSERQKEIDGTHYMIVAHAPLRTPEVADPDSTANREILHSMMTKALARERAKAPSAN